MRFQSGCFLHCFSLTSMRSVYLQCYYSTYYPHFFYNRILHFFQFLFALIKFCFSQFCLMRFNHSSNGFCSCYALISSQAQMEILYFENFDFLGLSYLFQQYWFFCGLFSYSLIKIKFIMFFKIKFNLANN